MKAILLLLVITITVASCNVGPKPITYGIDGCHSCSMTIVDRQHASQLVTKKGKVYKFDAIECLLQSLSEFEQDDIALYLVADYNTPGNLIDATTATYIISSNIPSPMSANISALATSTEAEILMNSHSGKLFNWGELQNQKL